MEMKEIDWTTYTLMEPTHRFYGRKCGHVGKRTNYERCKEPARYISTLGHLAVVHCEKCHQEASCQK